MLRYLRFCGALLINLAVAVIATAILEDAVRVDFHSYDQRNCVEGIILSVVWATFIGFFMRRTWRSAAAKWTWVLAALWFAFGYLSISGRGNAWGRLSGFSAESVFSGPDVRSFFGLTIPLIRTIFYSVAAFISSLVYPATLVMRGRQHEQER